MRKKYEAKNIELSKIRPVFVELVQRCGSVEAAAEYAGLGVSTMYRLQYRQYRTVVQRTARLLILALYQKRKEDQRNGSNERFNKALRKQADIEDKIGRLAGY